jgi:hypothetical protein
MVLLARRVEVVKLANNNKPVCFLVAIIDEVRTGTNGTATNHTRFEQIASFWPAQNSDNLTGKITVEPIEWGDPKFPRRVIIQFPRSGNA